MGKKRAFAIVLACLATVGCAHGAHRGVAQVVSPPAVAAPERTAPRSDPPRADLCEDEPDTRSPSDKLLEASIAKDDLEGVKKAVAEGARLDDGAALLEADGHPAIFRFLKAKGAKEPTLLQAIDAGSVATVERLLASGVKPVEDASGNDPLTVAASEADVTPPVRRRLVALLIAHGANAKTSDAFNRAADCVDVDADDGKDNVDRCDPELMRIFLRNGAVVDRGTLFYAFRYPDSVRTQMLDVFFSARIAPNDVADALAGADSPQRLALVTRIVKKIGPQNLPIDDAAKQLDIDLLRALFDAGARADNARGDAAMVDVLAQLKERDERTPIIKLNTVLGLLLAHGANPNRRVGELPIAIARSHGDASTIHLLVKAGAQEPPPSLRTMPTRALTRTPSMSEFRDPWLPKWDPGSHM